MPALTRRRALAGLAGVAVATGLFGGPAVAAAAGTSVSNVLNRTSRVRALSMRSAKAFAQVHLHVLAEHSQDLFEECTRLARTDLQRIGEAGVIAANEQHLARLRSAWDVLAGSGGSAGNLAKLVAVSGHADAAYAAADQLIEAVHAATKQDLGRLIEVSGRLRGRSQRLARNFLLAAAGHDAHGMRDQLQSDRVEFVSALDQLSRAPVSTPAIRNELSLVQTQWTFFEAAIGRKPDEESLRHVATTSDRIYEVADSLTALYDAALHDILG